MKVIGYVRVSTQRQAKEGVSLDTQEKQIHAWATLHGATILCIYRDEGISGRKRDRPGFIQARDHVMREHATLVAPSLSRLGRSFSQLAVLKDEMTLAKANLVTIKEGIDTTTAIGRFIFGLFAALAEFEAEQLSERTSDCAQSMKEDMLRYTNVEPFGYRWKNGRMVPHPPEQATIARIHQLGLIPVRQAQTTLTQEGHLGRTGEPLALSTIFRIRKQNHAAQEGVAA